jgi:HD superfamily phosphodiesterase
VIFRSKAHVEKLTSLEEKLIKIEARLAFIEKHGVILSAGSATLEGKRELDAKRRDLLRAIVEANKLLRNSG